MEHSEKTLDTIVALCKNRGFVFPGSEIYGGLANSWDYGPLGVEFKNNVKKAWLKKFVQESPYNVGLDAAILMNPQTWVTTGHVASFSDPLLDCRACKARHRADKLIADEFPDVNVDAMSFDEMDQFIAEHPQVVCPVCGKHDFTPIRKFNLMFKTAIGVTEDSSSVCYLRPETAQGIFVNFANIQRTTRRKLFIFISHAEGAHPAGRTARKVEYDADVKIMVSCFKAWCKSRFMEQPGEPYVIWEEGAAKALTDDRMEEKD